jgi:hypothetical protein
VIALVVLGGLVAEPDAFPVPPIHKILVELQLWTDADWERVTGPDLSQFRLDRGEAGATVGLGSDAGAEVRLETVRSAQDGGVLGIAGDSLVPRIKRAQVFGRYDAGPVHLEGAIGVVADPWITALEDGDTERPLVATASEGLLGWSPSDLAALVRARLGPVRLSVSFGNGEGLSYPERNQGKTTTAVAEVVPYVDRDLRVRVIGMARDGSIGPALVRDRRAGGGAVIESEYANAGGEIVHAWGVGDRTEATGNAFAGWAEARPVPFVAIAARAAQLRLADGGKHTTWGGAVALQPWPKQRLRLWLAFDRTTSSGSAEPVPGGDPADATTLMLLVSATAPFAYD